MFLKNLALVEVLTFIKVNIQRLVKFDAPYTKMNTAFKYEIWLY